MSDAYQNYTSSLRDPVREAETVTPDDGTDLNSVSRALYVGGQGDLRVTLVNGSDVIFRSAPVGWHPVRAQRVWATGTSATDIIACS